MACEGQRQVFGQDAAAVVNHQDQVSPALDHFQVDARAAGVDCILEQLLDDAGGPLDDLAGGSHLIC